MRTFLGLFLDVEMLQQKGKERKEGAVNPKREQLKSRRLTHTAAAAVVKNRNPNKKSKQNPSRNPGKIQAENSQSREY